MARWKGRPTSIVRAHASLEPVPTGAHKSLALTDLDCNALCATGDKKLATKSTDGQELELSNDKLKGEARDAEVRRAMEAKLGGVSDCATGGGRVVFGKSQTADHAAGPGAGPSKASRAVRMDGSAPGRKE